MISNIGVSLHQTEHEMRIEGHIPVEKGLAHHTCGKAPGLFEKIDGFSSFGVFFEVLGLILH